MDEFFTWGVLLTGGGAATLVSLITQFTKDIGFLKKIPTKLQIYVLSLLILFLANIFSDVRDLAFYALLPANALIVSLIAMGEYHELLHNLDNKSKKK